MKQKLFAIVTAFSFLCGMASAQSYSIRVSFNTNLRASPSLQAHIIETAPAGTILSVVGEFNRWLHIDRSGSEVWMASWVSHTRVEQNAPAQAQPARQIDNCCFVDRQCNTDQDWNDGYWAFQNGQCAAPAQTQPQTQPQASTQPVAASPPVGVDNCCFLNWQCTTDEQWRSGFQAYSTNQCNHPGVAIEGSSTFITGIEEALDLLKQKAPRWYTYTLAGLDKIVPYEHPKYGAQVSTRQRRVRVDIRGYTTEAGGHSEWTRTSLASSLLHEACHVHRYQAGVAYSGLEGEKACVEVEIKFLRGILPPNHGLLRSHVEKWENMENPDYQWWN
ncbi:MAG: SH3 domain-containing protein [Chloroflexi bacterium]|nr:SH3 domain-containing protein [Chloroflexota bacterium]